MSPILSPPLADLPLGLVLIRQKALVGHLPGNHKVYKITKIAVIPLSDEEPQELELEVCILTNLFFNIPNNTLNVCVIHLRRPNEAAET